MSSHAAFLSRQFIRLNHDLVHIKLKHAHLEYFVTIIYIENQFLGKAQYSNYCFAISKGLLP